MFLERSRYYKVKKSEVELASGRTVKAVLLRRLPTVEGVATVVKENDRLDIFAQRRYEDPTRFWHIADANTELKATDLVAETGRKILVPES